jgi:solute carrier family 25 uncoupling protein 8/9
MDAYAKIARNEGVAALWTGLGPNVARNAIINAAELASYDQVKQVFLSLSLSLSLSTPHPWECASTN